MPTPEDIDMNLQLTAGTAEHAELAENNTVRIVEDFAEQKNIKTALSDIFVLNPAKRALAVVKRNTAEESLSSLLVSNDPQDVIEAGEATFVEYRSGRESGFVMLPFPITAVRVAIKAGDFSIQVRQV